MSLSSGIVVYLEKVGVRVSNMSWKMVAQIVNPEARIVQHAVHVCIPTEGDRGFRRMMTAESDDVDR